MSVPSNNDPLIRMLCDDVRSLPALRRIDPVIGKPPIFKHRLLPGSFGLRVTNNTKDVEILKKCLSVKNTVLQQEQSKQFSLNERRIPNTTGWHHYDQNIRTLAKQILSDNNLGSSEQEVEALMNNPDQYLQDIKKSSATGRSPRTGAINQNELGEVKSRSSSLSSQNDVSFGEVDQDALIQDFEIMELIERQPQEVQKEIVRSFSINDSVENFLQKIRNRELEVSKEQITKIINRIHLMRLGSEIQPAQVRDLLDAKLFGRLLNGIEEFTPEIEKTILSKSNESKEKIRKKQLEDLVLSSENPVEFVRYVAQTRIPPVSDEEIRNLINSGNVSDLFPLDTTARQLRIDCPHYFNPDLYFLHQLEQHKNPNQKKMVEQWLVRKFGQDLFYAGHSNEFILKDIKNKIKKGELSLGEVTFEKKIAELMIKNDHLKPKQSGEL